MSFFSEYVRPLCSAKLLCVGVVGVAGIAGAISGLVILAQRRANTQLSKIFNDDDSEVTRFFLEFFKLPTRNFNFELEVKIVGRRACSVTGTGTGSSLSKGASGTASVSVEVLQLP